MAVRLSAHRFYSPEFSYPVLLPREYCSEEFLEIDEWIWNNIGEVGKDFEYDFWPTDSYILFKREEDKVKFILRWM